MLLNTNKTLIFPSLEYPIISSDVETWHCTCSDQWSPSGRTCSGLQLQQRTSCGSHTPSLTPSEILARYWKLHRKVWVNSTVKVLKRNLQKFKITAGNAGLIKCWQLCTDFNPSAPTFNKVGYRVDGTVFVYSEATVSTYAMKMMNAYELIPNPPASNHLTVTSKLLRYFLSPKDSSRYLNHSFP